MFLEDLEVGRQGGLAGESRREMGGGRRQRGVVGGKEIGGGRGDVQI